MRRFPAIVLLLVAISLSLIAPMLLAAAEKELPACCRREGNHHCAKMRGHQHGEGVQIAATSVCPLYPAGMSVPAAVQPAAAPPVLSSLHRPAPAPSTQMVPSVAQQQPASIRPWQQRGPPSPVA